MNTSEEIQQVGEALLATVRQVMTGREIEACEWTQSADFVDDFEGYRYRDQEMEPDYELFDHHDDFETAHGAWEKRAIENGRRDKATAEKLELLNQLAVPYSREIANHIDEENRAASRRAVETHNRLHPTAA